MKILEDLWYGNLCPIEQAGYRSEDCKTLLELFNMSIPPKIAHLDRLN